MKYLLKTNGAKIYFYGELKKRIFDRKIRHELHEFTRINWYQFVSKKEKMTKDKVILGIDPGTTIMGFGVIHVKQNNMAVLDIGVLHLSKLSDHPLKLKKIY